ncbi:MAG: excinuclease ABC subunit UvrC [Oscillospiraceae bacterium]|nr:excinuclease ABC subunit UvrC [Oscillospiraceae bacterium]
MSEKKISELHDKARALTSDPGVYLMHDKGGNIIYVGKAKNLKNRVSSYFRSVNKHTPKVYAMVCQVDYFETIITSSEFEALVLECSLIKRHTPKYNILLKDDKGFCYLRIDNGPYPRITEAKIKADDGAQYIGPYLSSWIVKQTADEVNKAFGLPTCTRVFPRDFKKERPCLNFHMKQCMGVCRGCISQEEYAETLRQAIEYIRGGSAESVKILTTQMEEAAENLEFERAARCRDRIRAIERFAERQRVVFTGVADQDVLAFVRSGQDVSLSVLRFRKQKLVDKMDFIFENSGPTEEVREEFISRYYSDPAHELPAMLTVDELPPDHELIERLLTERLGKKVVLYSPQRGENVRVMDMAKLNAAEQFSMRDRKRTGKELTALDDLGKLLGLEKPPTYIESYDISNIGGETIVGGMVVFEDGRPLKKAYRKFSMPGFSSPDDYACMAQMIERRFTHYQNRDEGFDRQPDLLLIDGGKGHVSAVCEKLCEMGLSIPVFGMVKDDRHRTRAIAEQGGEISIAANKSVFSLITKIQDETHRFAISFARQRHSSGAFELSLTKVEGIGPARARALYKHFKTKKAILAASEEELTKAPNMTAKASKNLRIAIENGEIG